MGRVITSSFALLSLLTFVACDPQPDITGVWELELVDADHCLVSLDLEQDGEDIYGEADLECTLYFSIDGESYTYEMEADGAKLEGTFDFDRQEFEVEFEFYDDLFEQDIEIALEGEVFVDEMEGEVTLGGEDWGEFEGELD